MAPPVVWVVWVVWVDGEDENTPALYYPIGLPKNSRLRPHHGCPRTMATTEWVGSR